MGYGMDMTRDKLMTLVKKFFSLIEAHNEVRTSDGHTLRLFCIAFSQRRTGQTKRTCYATSAQIRRLRKRMRDIMTKEVSKVPMREVVKKLIPESMGKEIQKACHGICPIEHVFMRKVKIVKKPKFDLTKLMEL